MNYIKFDPRDPAYHGPGFTETPDGPPPEFIAVVDQFIERYQPENYPRPFLSATRCVPIDEEGRYTGRSRQPTWTIALRIPFGEMSDIGGYVEWHDDHAVALDGSDGRVLWKSPTVTP